MPVTIQEVIRILEETAPPAYQEEYDNSGFLCGDLRWEVRGVLVCLDTTEAVLEEAAQLGCNLVVSHHPILFKGLKRLTGATYVERTVMQAIRQDIAIYAIHTNLDSMYVNGVNSRIAQQLELQHTRILAPKDLWRQVRLPFPTALFGTLQSGLAANGGAELLSALPITDGEELLCELRFDAARQKNIEKYIAALHPSALQRAVWQNALGPHPGVGGGMIGELPVAMSGTDFLHYLKARMQTQCVRYTALPGRDIRRVAVCGGAGSFLLKTAIAQGADAYVSADFKYHEFFDADGRILIADIGHYESEQFTIQLLQEIISSNFPNFAAYCAKTITNPVQYY
jgi:dinuclear metal center YbgI/SA1388 family protein